MQVGTDCRFKALHNTLSPFLLFCLGNANADKIFSFNSLPWANNTANESMLAISMLNLCAV